ncbi:MAG: hypothetical protein F7C35_08115 [Desulfurococcales archaeon]|nr:hypothetical protein [Desulfurococcales archaeon]
MGLKASAESRYRVGLLLVGISYISLGLVPLYGGHHFLSGGLQWWKLLLLLSTLLLGGVGMLILRQGLMFAGLVETSKGATLCAAGLLVMVPAITLVYMYLVGYGAATLFYGLFIMAAGAVTWLGGHLQIGFALLGLSRTDPGLQRLGAIWLLGTPIPPVVGAAAILLSLHGLPRGEEPFKGQDRLGG